MSRLHSRIASQAGAAAAAAGEMHPAVNGDTPMTMPMVGVFFGGGGAWTEQMAPMVAARGGAPIPATGPGRYGQVHIAGGGRYS